MRKVITHSEAEAQAIADEYPDDYTVSIEHIGMVWVVTGVWEPQPVEPEPYHATDVSGPTMQHTVVESVGDGFPNSG